MLKHESYMAGDVGTSLQKSFLRLLVRWLCFSLPSILDGYSHCPGLSRGKSLYFMDHDEITSASCLFGLSTVIVVDSFIVVDFI